jgi:hypothetical protein
VGRSHSEQPLAGDRVSYRSEPIASVPAVADAIARKTISLENKTGI